MTAPTLHWVDAFADGPFTGNPAAIYISDQFPSDEWMQNLAGELGLSETAYLHPSSEVDVFHLRWFTPTTEVDLCGHATLAAAHVLWSTQRVTAPRIRFVTTSGALFAHREGDRIRLEFPALSQKRLEGADGFEEILGSHPLYLGASQSAYLAELESEDDVRALEPDLTALRRATLPGLIVTAKSVSPEYDFVSRCFFPAEGIPEDPVTGSAHCLLAPYWAKRLKKTRLRAYQASDRGGTLETTIEGDRVHLTGRAITLFTANVNSV